MNVPKIRFEKFTEEWHETSIGQVAHIFGGGTPSTSNIHYWGGGIQWFTPSEVGHCKYINKSERTISELGLNESSAKLLPKNSILLSSRATIGEMSINTCECATNQGFQSLVPYNADLEFLFYIMHTKKNDLIRESNGSTFLEISANKVRSLGLVVPKRNEQEKIGLFLKNLDSSIETLSKKITSLKQTKQACLQSMFPQPGETRPRIRFKGFEGDWEKKTIRDVCYHQSSSLTQNSLGKKHGSYPVFGASGFIQNINSYDQAEPYIGVIKDGSGVGRVGLYPAFSSLLGTMQYLRVNEVMDIVFLYALLQTKDLSMFITGSTIPHIYFKDYAELEIFVPSREEQQQIASFFSNIDKQTALQEQQLEKLKQIKVACLDNMFV